ncbi:IPT/TIG domain-containing protein [Pedobacter caeni]|uniref:NHL repeat-containing protein n=1 Tax=Pedobacter caeni TaxID=288992 RepID=A0A1M5BEI4_9SPHI|nr:IPT/TIG domain-containing protein [Pedobacter caeni]SHF40904.1 NHL repeat-containing protein [Pedobacter caeni]
MNKIFTLLKVHIRICLFFLALLFFLWGCKKESGPAKQVHDPNQPIELRGFLPDSGGVGTQMVIEGNNFGTDTSMIKVFINNKRAALVGANGSTLYVLVPSRANNGLVKVQVGKGDQVKEIISKNGFRYIFRPAVSSLAGFKDKDGKTAIVDGPFEKAQFEEPYWMTFDQNKNIYLLEQRRGLRFIDMAKREVKTLFRTGKGMDRPRTLSFSPSWDVLYVTNDQWDERGLSTATLTPASGFKEWNSLIYNKTTNGGAAHPQTGDYFYNSYVKGEVFKWNKEGNSSELLFRVDDNDWEFNIQFAPSGDFAYIVVVNRHYILKSRYNRQTRKLEAPVHFVGGRGGAGHNDGVGTDARFKEPHQGAFDENDNFYIADISNHCIRKITPEGVVSTFAGRPGSPGYADGGLRDAQFNQPSGIVYDPATGTFYVADLGNSRIRAISIE